MNATEMQYRAFLAVVVAATLVALAPIVVSGVRGEALPAGLIDIADKSVVAFAGLLGAIGALLFRQNATDQARAETQSKALDTVQAAIAAQPPGRPKGTPDDPVSVDTVEADRG